MESVLFILVVLFLIKINNSLNKKFKNLEDTIDKFNHRIQILTQKLSANEVTEKKEETTSKQQLEAPQIIKPSITGEKTAVFLKKTEEKPGIPIANHSVNLSYTTEDKIPVKTRFKEAQKSIPKKPWIQAFKEKNPDLEKFIGENLINKLGILILVLGISFFVKYAIDKNWINEPARVGIGVLCGSLVMTIAHKLKKNYAAFSSVLVAGAISVFYLTIYIAFHEYQLFSQAVAFIIMVIITAFSTLLSVSYNRQELAILSLIGGFAVPLMLSTGEGSYIVLFTYCAILNIGILTISYFKKWKVVTILAFIFTLLLYVFWLRTNIGKTNFSSVGALIFAAVFYFIFSLTIVLYNLKNKGDFSLIEYIILTANTFFFFGFGMVILNDLNSNYTGLFTLLLGAYNVLYAAILYKKFGLDKNAIYLLIGLALTFVTLTIPIQFHGNQITLFWAAEAVLLFWVSQKSKISSFKIGAVVVQILAVISLLVDWKGYALSEELAVVLNRLFIAGFVVSSSLFFTYLLLKKEKEIHPKIAGIGLHFYRKVAFLLAILATYFTGLLEIYYQALQFYSTQASALSLPITYHFVFISVLLYFSGVLKNEKINKGIFLISMGSVFLYIVSFYVLPSSEIIVNFINNTDVKVAFYLHYIVLGCLVYFGFQWFQKTNALFNINSKQSKWLPWIFVFATVYILSNEIMLHSLHFFSGLDTAELAEKFPDSKADLYMKKDFVHHEISRTKAQIVKIGYPILWGVFSFIFLVIGIKKQWKNLRIIALSLLGLTIVKLFVYDIKNVSETGKIIAFILLGVLILVISFVYQKIRKLVVDEKVENKIKIEDEKI